MFRQVALLTSYRLPKLCNFIVVKFTPTALRSIGYRTYIVFAVFNAAWVPIIAIFLPETKGKTLEEIDEVFATDNWRLNRAALV